MLPLLPFMDPSLLSGGVPARGPGVSFADFGEVEPAAPDDVSAAITDTLNAIPSALDNKLTSGCLKVFIRDSSDLIVIDVSWFATLDFLSSYRLSRVP